MYRTIVILAIGLFALTGQEGLTRDRTLSTEERTRLKNVQTVFVQTIALTERGTADPKDIHHVITQRLQELGLKTHDQAETPYDVLVKVKCEERKTDVGPSKYGGDADSVHAPSRSWTGPACQIMYGVDGHDTAWEMEVRTPFSSATRAARKARVKDTGKFALDSLRKVLQENDFPYLLTAEWGQADRLSAIVRKPDTSQTLKLKIIPLLGTIPESLPFLQETLNDPSLAPSAAVAIGQQGQQGTDVLLNLLTTTQDTSLKVSAVKGLGEIASHSSQIPVFTPLLVALQEPTTELPVQTEIVKALGKLADQRAVEPLTALNRQAWTTTSQDPDMQQLREALSWSLWQLNPDAHAGE